MSTWPIHQKSAQELLSVVFPFRSSFNTRRILLKVIFFSTLLVVKIDPKLIHGHKQPPNLERISINKKY
jgi:hypothetical protein